MQDIECVDDEKGNDHWKILYWISSMQDIGKKFHEWSAANRKRRVNIKYQKDTVIPKRDKDFDFYFVSFKLERSNYQNICVAICHMIRLTIKIDVFA